VPTIRRLLETALYVEDLDRAQQFYERVLGLRPLYATQDPDAAARFRPMNVPGNSVLLLFRKGATSETLMMPGGTIPGHDGSGQLHFAFAVDSLDGWKEHLAECGVAIEGQTKWPGGGVSWYFRDPEENLVELATPGIWPTY